MSITFNFSGLKQIYFDTLHAEDKSFAFNIINGHGIFQFMMFLSSEDINNNDNLFIYMQNTNTFCMLKLYGLHKKGDFIVYINEVNRNRFINELQLEEGGNRFNFENFLMEINEQIPLVTDINERTAILRHNRVFIENNGLVDDADKTVLIGMKKLPAGQKPRDKTLRKLYLYTDAEAYVISKFISDLKRTNTTVAWTTEDNRYNAVRLADLINSIAG